MLSTWERSSNSLETHGHRFYLNCCRKARPTSEASKACRLPVSVALRVQVWSSTLGAWTWKAWTWNASKDTYSHRGPKAITKQDPCVCQAGSRLCSVAVGCADTPLQQHREGSHQLRQEKLLPWRWHGELRVPLSLGWLFPASTSPALLVTR